MLEIDLAVFIGLSYIMTFDLNVFCTFVETGIFDEFVRRLVIDVKSNRGRSGVGAFMSAEGSR